MSRARQRAFDTRAKIIAAAERIFLLRGATRTSLDDIAKEAGMTRRTMHGHFKNKQSVLHAMLESSSLPLDPFSIEPCSSDGDPLGLLRTDLHRCLRDVLQNARTRSLYGIVFTACESASETAQLCERIHMAGIHAEAQIEAALSCAVALGQLSADFDTRQAAAFIHGTLSGSLRKCLTMSPRTNTDAEIDQIAEAAFLCIDVIDNHISKSISSGHAAG
jgi:TetR/AcrR family acrAB operon transcriptional repressor